MSELVMRAEYINFLRRHRDKQVIKVVSYYRWRNYRTPYRERMANTL